MNRNLKFFGTWIVLAGVCAFGSPGYAKQGDIAFFSVDNMSCNACAAQIYNRLSQLNGFNGLYVNFKNKLIAIEYQNDLTPETVCEELAEIGKPARIIQMPKNTIDVLTPESGWVKQSNTWLSKVLKLFGF